MTLYNVTYPGGISEPAREEKVCDVPESVFSSTYAFACFLRVHASRLWQGKEDVDWQLLYNNTCLAPFHATRYIGRDNEASLIVK